MSLDEGIQRLVKLIYSGNTSVLSVYVGNDPVNNFTSSSVITNLSCGCGLRI